MTNHPQVNVVSHPVIQQRLTLARDKTTKVEHFRTLLSQIASLMAFELTRDYPTVDVEVDTPLGPCRGKKLAVELTLVPILRAGLGMTEGILQLIPEARVGHLGLYRDEKTLKPVTYYNKLPPDVAKTEVIIIDPMLATGGSLNVAIDTVKQAGAKSIKILCLVASPEGISAVTKLHPDVSIYTAAIDDNLDERGYIVPGLGDAGDRIFGTA
ncbi:MAG: uracil phosphoribosyltransferase [Phycisphaerae bacterium]|nr:MAG: uracil phosphoribosyltransferase [Phycisphaerae bacterium]